MGPGVAAERRESQVRAEQNVCQCVKYLISHTHTHSHVDTVELRASRPQFLYFPGNCTYSFLHRYISDVLQSEYVTAHFYPLSLFSV